MDRFPRACRWDCCHGRNTEWCDAHPAWWRNRIAVLGPRVVLMSLWQVFEGGGAIRSECATEV